MYRRKIEELIKWKDSPRRKPLILRGARQVGKTWLLREFGRQHYANTVYVNFEQAVELRTIFDQDYDVKRILQMLQLYARSVISHDTLIILDEIQAAPRGLTALKYFCEDAPQYQGGGHHLCRQVDAPSEDLLLHGRYAGGRRRICRHGRLQCRATGAARDYP